MLQCVASAGMDWFTIEQCAYGYEGNELLHTAGFKTEQLNPALNWVPWIVLNGVGIGFNFMLLVFWLWRKIITKTVETKDRQFHFSWWGENTIQIYVYE